AIVSVVSLAVVGITIWGVKYIQDTRSSAGTATILNSEDFESATILQKGIGKFSIPNLSTFSTVDLRNNTTIIPDPTHAVNPTKSIELKSNLNYVALEAKAVYPNTYLTTG